MHVKCFSLDVFRMSLVQIVATINTSSVTDEAYRRWSLSHRSSISTPLRALLIYYLLIKSFQKRDIRCMLIFMLFKRAYNLPLGKWRFLFREGCLCQDHFRKESLCFQITLLKGEDGLWLLSLAVQDNWLAGLGVVTGRMQCLTILQSGGKVISSSTPSQQHGLRLWLGLGFFFC